jgi:hypothetical protein
VIAKIMPGAARTSDSSADFVWRRVAAVWRCDARRNEIPPCEARSSSGFRADRVGTGLAILSVVHREEEAAMTARKSSAARGTRTRAARQRQVMRTLARVERQLPPTLAQFSRRMRKGLADLERGIEEAAAPARREIARVLCDASHALGRFEAEGARAWRNLTREARRDAIAALQRLEAALAEGGRPTAPSRPARPARPARRAAGTTARRASVGA